MKDKNLSDQQADVIFDRKLTQYKMNISKISSLFENIIFKVKISNGDY